MVKYFMRIVITSFLMFGFIEMTIGGVCWVKIMEGKCKEPIQRNISKENCCKAGPNVGFTEKDLNDFEYFFATAIGDGSACTSCVESCKTSKCGNGKKCIQRNDKPKCVCAPNCKASKKQQIDDNAKRTLSFIEKKSGNENVKIIGGLMKKRKRNSKYSHIIDKNADVDFVEPINSSVNLQKNERIILSDSKLFNKINSENKARLNFSKNPKNEFTKENHSSANVEVHHKNQKIFKNESKWPLMIRTGSHGYDSAFIPNQFPDNEHGTYFKPVCGTDGRSYKTECQLKKRACRREISTLQVAYKGQCQTSCKNVKCPPSMHCLEDQNLMPHCVSCAMKCPPYEKSLRSVVVNPSKLVCGTDGNTYRNLCEIKRAACVLGRSIPVAYRGPCDDTANCNNIKCKDRQICLNDLITHRPRCVSCSFKCPRKRKPQGKRDGKQKSSGVDATQIKLCGRNNRTYDSWCQMIKDSCHTGYYIDIEHNGECSTLNSTVMSSMGMSIEA